MAQGDHKGSLTASAASITNPTNLTGSVAVAVGDLVFGGLAQQTALTAAGTVTDNLGNTYAYVNAGTDAGNATLRCFYARVTVAGTLTQVSVPATASTNDASGIASVIEGPFLTSPLDANPANTTDGTSPHTGPLSGTLAQASEVVMGMCAVAANVTMTATSPFTLTQAVARANISCAASKNKVSATTSIAPEFGNGATANAVQVTASFKLDPVQALTPGLFTESDGFFDHTVTPGVVDLAPDLFTEADTFFTPVVAKVFPSFVNAGTHDTQTASTAITPSLPASLVTGNLLLAIIIAKQNTFTHDWSAATGWTKQGEVARPASSFSVSWGYRYVDGTEAAPTVTISSTDIICAGQCFQLKDARPSSPWGAENHADGSGTTHAVTGITTTADNSLVLYFEGANNNTGLSVPTGGWSEFNDAGNTAASSRIVIGGKQVATSGTASGDISATGANASWVMYQQELLVPAGDYLTPSLFTESDTFFTHTVTPGAVDVAPSLFTESDTYFTHTVEGQDASQDLAPSLFTETDTFHAPTVTATYALTAALYTETDTFHAPTVTSTYGLVAAHFSETDTFFAPTVAAGAVNLTPALYAETDTFHTPTVTTGAVNVSPSLYSETDTFFGPVVQLEGGDQHLSANLFTDTDTFHIPTVAAGAVNLAPALYSESDTFFTHAVAAGAVNISPSLYSEADAFFTHVVSAGANDLVAAHFAEADTFPTHTVTAGAINLTPALFNEGDAFFSPTVESGLSLSPALYSETDTFFSPVVAATYALTAALFVDTDAFHGAILGDGLEQELTPATFAEEDVFYGASIDVSYWIQRRGGTAVPRRKVLAATGRRAGGAATPR